MENCIIVSESMLSDLYKVADSINVDNVVRELKKMSETLTESGVDTSTAEYLQIKKINSIHPRNYSGIAVIDCVSKIYHGSKADRVRQEGMVV